MNKKNTIGKYLSIIVTCFSIFFINGCKTFCEKDLVNDKIEKSKKTYSIVIGMETSKAFGSCPGCRLDSNRMRDLLKPYSSAGMSFLQDSQATVNNVLKEFDKAIKSNSDLIIFYYSGHGGHQKFANTSNEVDGEDEFLCLYDSYLLDDLIWEKLITKSKRIHLIFDCCHSETMFRSSNILFENQIQEHSMIMQSAKDSSFENINMLVWSGCPDNTYSYGSSQGGLLTNAILKNFDKNKTYCEIWKNVLKTPNLKRQSPQRTQYGSGFGGKIFE